MSNTTMLRVPLVWALRFMLVVSSVLATPTASATTIEPMTLTTAADLAAQVIDARVTRTVPRWLTNPKRIETMVSFEQVSYLKGGEISGGSATFDLVVPGGTIGSVQMRIAGAPEFYPGDRWILFLLPTYKTYPVVGLTAGAFRVDESTVGTPRIRDASGRAVAAVRRDGSLDVVGETRVAPEQKLVGADKAHLRQNPQKFSRGMTRDEFVTALRPILAVSRRHVISHPAGRPNIPLLTPTSLKTSERQNRNHPERQSKSVRTQEGPPAAASSNAGRRTRP